MEWKELAPWIAIALTLILSILVPLFTQIANNSHQRKMQYRNAKMEKYRNQISVFEDFLADVGGVVIADGHAGKEALTKAGASLHRVYIYAPADWYEDLDKLSELLIDFEWKKALPLVQKMSKLVSIELEKYETKI